MNKVNTVWNHCRPEDFVPTTHDVRSNYVGLEFEFSFTDAHVDSDACVAEFDRWLAEVIREAKREERALVMSIAKRRHDDLANCHKQDDCHLLAHGIWLAMDDVEEAERKEQ